MGFTSGRYRICRRLLCSFSTRRSPRAVDQDARWVRQFPLPLDSHADKISVLSRHIEVTPEHNGNIFFWHFENKHIADKQRTVIWLNGGPGCSSEDGALMEIGPYRLKDAANLRLNDGSWHEFANIMFVDNPVGTGYSYVDTDSFVHELDEMARQFVVFLEKWFALFPEYEHDNVSIFPSGFRSLSCHAMQRTFC
jgi:carboxypeptidase D